MHVTFDKVLDAATDIGEGYRKATVTLAEGDTLWCPGSTKKVLRGAGEYTFLIHASGVELTRVPEGARDSYLMIASK